MPRKVDKDFDKDVLNYLKSHTWKETQDNFNISSRTIKNMKERNSISNEIESKVISKVDSILPETKNDIQKVIGLFYKALDIPQFLKLVSDKESEAINRLESIQ